MNTPIPRRRPAGRPGFTLIELLVVIAVIALLVGLLVPAVTSALRAANNASGVSEINALAQALASFKNQYGDFPPSRVVLYENGYYPVSSTAPLPTSNGTADQSVGSLAARSVTALRKFFPRAQTSTTAPLYTTATVYHDFNGNGVNDGATPILLEGHECLVFFLGGIPQPGTVFGMTGFARDPVNPFRNSTATDNRTAPFFEFRGDRLLDHDGDGIPSYVDNFKVEATTQVGGTFGLRYGFYAYFSAYGNNNYDPNDNNFADDDAIYAAQFLVNSAYPTNSSVAGSPFSVSPGPNPYTVGLPIPLDTSGGPVTGPPTKYHNPQTFQIISAGADGIYGSGGQYLGSASDSPITTNPYSSTLAGSLTISPARPVPNDFGEDRPPSDYGATRRNTVERDNLTNFNPRQLN